MTRYAGIALLAAMLQAAPAPERIDWAVAVFPSGARFELELALDPQSKARGYMYRERVGPDEGMLFLWDEESAQSFWMKNCKVPLDIIFLDQRFDVVEIAADQPPCPAEGECPSIAPMRFAKYVLEVAGGIAARNGLRVGDRVTILSDPDLP